MPRNSVLEYFRADSRAPNEIAVAWRRGYRMERWSYERLLNASTHFAAELSARGIAKGDRVLLWGENSGEWVAAFVGCMLRGAVAVPMDATADKSFAARVVEQAGIRLAVVGRGLPSFDKDDPDNRGDASAPVVVRLEEIGELAGRPAAAFAPAMAARGDAIEIVFTSGTTAEPRGVVITHGNVLSNLEPIEREFQRYRRYERLFHPLRLLDLLPLSHVFGQLLGIFLPQVIGATSLFLDTWNPADVVRVIRDERVSVLITVPRLIESLREQLERNLAACGKLGDFERSFLAGEGEHFLKRWWRFRSIRRRFGWQFWALVSGGAALGATDEQFWTRLGYPVIQGYGLTETTSLVSLNHPFRLERGSIGKALAGLETKLSPEGEILVRGPSVAAGYWKDSQVTPATDAEGWFHTGDMGERDAAGHLFFKGRLKNVIVTPEGLNVYPQDLEAELRKEPAVRDCLVVGLARDGNAEPCAVLILRNSVPEPAAIVKAANDRLAPFQRMRHWFVWPDNDFPRTPTQKPALARISAIVEAEIGGGKRAAAAAAENSPLAEMLLRISPDALPSGSGGELQLSSIERVELMSELENRYQVDLGEVDFAAAGNLAVLEKLVEDRPAVLAGFRYPRWPQSWPARIVRAVVINLLARPAMLLLGWPSVRGRENLRSTSSPALVIANHITYFDPAYVLEGLPARFRRRLAVAMDGERLESMRNPPPGTGWFIGLRDRVAYFLVLLIFNVFPLPRRAGFRKSFAFAGNLIDRGWSVLVFPEGERTRTTGMNPFRAGIGLLATRLGVPVVPVWLGGIAERRARGKHWARPGEIRVSIGEPVRFEEDTAAEQIARDLERRVAELGINGNR